MARRLKKVKPEPIIAQPKQDRSMKTLLGESKLYKIKKFGLYEYQIYVYDMKTGQEIQFGIPNVYQVVGSTLVDIVFDDINPGLK